MHRQRQRIPAPECDQAILNKSVSQSSHESAGSIYSALNPRQASVMRVQQTFGNAAVRRMLAAQRSPAVALQSSIQRWPWDDDESSSENQSEGGGDNSASEFSWPWEGQEVPRVTHQGANGGGSPRPQPDDSASESGGSSSASSGSHTFVVPSGVGSLLTSATSSAIEAEGYAQKMGGATSTLAAGWGALEGSTMSTNSVPPDLFAEGQTARTNSNGLASAAASAKSGLDTAHAKLVNAADSQN